VASKARAEKKNEKSLGVSERASAPKQSAPATFNRWPHHKIDCQVPQEIYLLGAKGSQQAQEEPLVSVEGVKEACQISKNSCKGSRLNRPIPQGLPRPSAHSQCFVSAQKGPQDQIRRMITARVLY
jgi:hypothetical protein